MKYLLNLIIFVFINLSFSSLALESEWSESEKSKARLISPLTHNNNQNEIFLGLEYQMQPGWKTYWSSPGDAGFPQELLLEKSQNIKDIELFWPNPSEFEILEMNSLGYENNVIFPLKIQLDNPNKKTNLNLSIKYLICKNICIPGEANIFIEIPSGKASKTKHFFQIEKTLSQLPKKNFNLSKLYNLQTEVIKDEKHVSVIVNAKTNSYFENTKIYLDTEFGLPYVEPIINFSFDNQSLDAKFYFDEKLISKKFFNLKVLLIDKNHNYLFTDKVEIKKNNQFLKLTNNNIYYLLAALIGGLILNAMPCVLPVLSIKLLSVLQNNNDKIRSSFIITSIGIITSFVFLAFIFILLKKINISISWGMQFQQPYFLIVISFILSAFMLNMFGFFEFKTPELLNNKAAIFLNKNNFTKSYFNGFFATLMATPCSAPFVGTALTAAFTQSTTMMLLIFLFMGIGMSIPYIFVALFPPIISFLPKPGKWMVKFKYFLGFLLFLTLIWVFNILLNYFNIYFIFTSLILLSLTIYFLKNFNNISLIFSITFIIFVSLPIFDIFKQEKNFVSELDWKNFSNTSIENLIEKNNIVFLDITADWCATCQFNKLNILNDKNILEVFKKNKVIKIRGDWTKPDKKIETFLNSKNKFGIPYNAFFSKTNPEGIALSEILTKGEIIETINRLKQ